LNKYRVSKKDRIVIASHNQGKIKEFKTLFSKYNFKILSSNELNIHEVDETGSSFEDNAIIKVKSIPDNFIAIGDDSGLCVKSLKDKPGIFSARFSKKCGGWNEAMKKIFNQVSKLKKPNYSAKFFCALAIKFKNKKIFTYTGEVFGNLVWPPKGNNGFGYDPFFKPISYKKTFSQMKHSEKILIDHRFVAFQKLATKHLNSI